MISVIELLYYFLFDFYVRYTERSRPTLPLYTNECWTTKASKKFVSVPYQNLVKLSADSKAKLI